MKKFLLVLVFALAFGLQSFANDKFAVDDNIEYLTNDSIVMTNINKSINRYLKIKDDQILFYDVFNDMYDYINYLDKEQDKIAKEFNMHLKHDLNLSKMILDDNQYKKYLLILNQTLYNKDLLKYINNN